MQEISEKQHSFSPKGHHKIVVKENTETTIFEKDATGTSEIHIVVEENAKVLYLALTMHDAHITRTATLGRNASINWVEYASAENITSDVTTILAGEGADAQFKGILLGTHSQKYNIRTVMIHQASKTTSNMLTRAVMLDNSHGNYEGLIRIMPHAAGCDAYQRAETLLLGEKATMHATPNLEINNEEVKCSHGVSLGQIEGEKLFYLASRGIGRKQAIALIVEGFFAKVIDAMGEHSVLAHDDVMKRVHA